MKIFKEDDRQMILKEGAVGGYIIGIIFFIFGLLMTFQPEFFNIKQPPLWAGILFTVAGLVVIFLYTPLTITIDRAINRMTFCRKGLVINKTKFYPLEKIKGVELTVSEIHSNKGKSKSYNLFFIMADGDAVTISNHTESLGVTNLQSSPLVGIGQRLTGYLDVPFTVPKEPTVGDVFSALTDAFAGSADEKKEKYEKFINK